MLLEITAPPGAGKTTLVRALVTSGATAGLSWSSAELARLRPRWGGSDPVLRAATRRGTRSLLRSDTLRRALLRSPTDAEIQEALASVAVDWDPFLRVIASAPSAQTGLAALDVMARGWLTDAVATRALLDSHRGPVGPDEDTARIVLIDEGLLHPYKVEAAVGREDLDRRDEYLDATPLPDVVAHLRAPVAVVAERIERRHATQPETLRAQALASSDGGPGSSPSTAEAERLVDLTEQIVAAVRRRGVPVIAIDASTSIDQQVAMILDSIRSLLAGSPT